MKLNKNLSQLIFWVTMSLTTCFGQSFREQSYGYFDGLQSDDVLYTFISEKGLVYVITSKEIFLFDGYRFDNYGKRYNHISSFHFKNEKLYFEDGKALKIKDFSDPQMREKVLHTLIPIDSDPNNDHYDNLFLDHSGRLWSTDFEHIKYDFNGKLKSFKVFPGNSELRKNIHFLQIDSKTLWISTHKGLFTYDTWNDKLINEFINTPLNSLCKLKDGKIALATSEGKLYYLDSHLSKKLLPIPYNDKDPIIDFLPTDKATYAYSSNCIYILDVNGLKLIHTLNDKKIRHINKCERSGILWISTSNGLVKLTPPRKGISIDYLPDEGQSSSPIISFVENLDGKVFALQQNGTIWKQESQSWKKIVNGAIGGKSIQLINNRILVMAQSGVFVLINEQLEKLPLSNFNSKSNAVKCIEVDGQLWILFENAPIQRYWISNWEPIHSNFRNDEKFWAANKWNDILVDDHKNIWLVGWMPKGFGICKYDYSKNEFIEISTKSFGNDRSQFVGDYYNRIAKTKDGQLLFSAYGGFNRTDMQGKINLSITMNEYAIMDSYLTGISQDNYGNIFFCTNEGVHIYLEKQKSVVRLDKTAGLPSNRLFNGFLTHSDGTLYIGIENAIVRINPNSTLVSTDEATFNVSKVLIDGKQRFYTGNKINLSKTESNLTIYFSYLSYQDPSQLTYFYRLNSSEKWISLGHNPEVSFNHLEPGSYNLELKVVDFLLNQPKEYLKIKIVAATPFFKSVGFKLLIGGLIFLLLFIFFHIRLRQKTRVLRYEKRLQKAEMDTLRAQMNPHFMFNTLNSINSFILQSDKMEASKYLTTFSKLMRRILDNSKRQSISLSNELATLKLYLQLESARLEHSFAYNFKVDPSIDLEDIHLPPMLIQPFVENAIWHGLSLKKEGGLISISISLTEASVLQIVIEDNGVGRQKSTEKKDLTGTRHKSYGVDITVDRLKLVNRNNSFWIEDLYHEDGSASGTRVILKLIIGEDEDYNH